MAKRYAIHVRWSRLLPPLKIESWARSEHDHKGNLLRKSAATLYYIDGLFYQFYWQSTSCWKTKEYCVDFTAFDFETANEKRASPCSCGIAIVRDGKIVETKHWLIRPKEFRFESMNIMIHGITENMVRRAPEFDAVWPEIFQYMSDTIMVAHNASFDMSVLRQTAALYGLTLPPMKFACTRVIAKHVWPTLPSYQLGELASRLRLKFKHHQADEDARACAEIGLEACRRESTHSLEELAEKLGFRNGSLTPDSYKSAGAKRVSKAAKAAVAPVYSPAYLTPTLITR